LMFRQAYADPILKLDVFSGSIRSGKKPVVWVEITAVQNKSGCAEGALLQLDIDRP